ncbi:MAG: DUF2723 domain-containing protein, partial [Anaerolineales bacterium]
TVMWYDMGEFATAAYVLGIAHNTGYPLVMLLGKLFTFLPVGDIAYRVNLMSAFFGALTVLFLYMVVFEITRRRLASGIAALTLAFTSTLWSNATWATSYDLNAFLTVLILWMALRWRSERSIGYLYAAGLTFGLSLGNHRMILGLIPALGYLVWAELRSGDTKLNRRQAAILAGLVLAGSAVNLYLPLRAAQDPPLNWGDPSSLEGFVTMILTGAQDIDAFSNPLADVGSLWRAASIIGLYPSYEFSLLGLLIAAVGCVWLFKRDQAFWVSTVLLSLFAVVIISVYAIHNIFNYFQPIYLAMAIWLGVGIDGALKLITAGLSRPQPSIITHSRGEIIAGILMLVLPLSLLSRNFQTLNRSQHLATRDFADYIFNKLDDYSVLLTDFWSWAPLSYAQNVNDEGKTVWVDAALANPNLDMGEVLSELMQAGAPVYIARRFQGDAIEQIGDYRLKLIAPGVVYSMTTEFKPLPEYKDLLVPRGGLYEVVRDDPGFRVSDVPSGDRLDADFASGPSLRGFTIDRLTLNPGEQYQLSLYWSLAEATSTDYWADVVFVTSEGEIPALRGIPLWQQGHWLGGGAYPTSEWLPGEIVKESYDGLVPRGIEPGAYSIWISLYTGGERETLVPLAGDSSASGLDLAQIEVRE